MCLLNGTDDTKACADFITDLDVENDGFADFINKKLFTKYYYDRKALIF